MIKNSFTFAIIYNANKMEDFNSEEKNMTENNNGLTVEEQIAQIEKEIRGKETETYPNLEQENDNNSCEAKPKKCKCNCGMIIGVCGLVLGLTAIILFLLMFTGAISIKNSNGEKDQDSDNGNNAQVSTTNVVSLPASDSTAKSIAYIDLDTLLLTYNYAVKLQEDLAIEKNKAEITIQSRMKKFEDMYNAYAEKVRTGMFLSQSSQQAQQNELEKEQQAIETLQASLTNKLLDLQDKMNHEKYDTVLNIVNKYASDKYYIVLGNMGGTSVVYAQQGMNITPDVVAILNQRYGGISTKK